MELFSWNGSCLRKLEGLNYHPNRIGSLSSLSGSQELPAWEAHPCVRVTVLEQPSPGNAHLAAGRSAWNTREERSCPWKCLLGAPWGTWAGWSLLVRGWPVQASPVFWLSDILLDERKNTNIWDCDLCAVGSFSSLISMNPALKILCYWNIVRGWLPPATPGLEGFGSSRANPLSLGKERVSPVRLLDVKRGSVCKPKQKTPQHNSWPPSMSQPYSSLSAAVPGAPAAIERLLVYVHRALWFVLRVSWSSALLEQNVQDNTVGSSRRFSINAVSPRWKCGEGWRMGDLCSKKTTTTLKNVFPCIYSVKRWLW